MRGVLLLQLGTPDSPDTKAVRRYLNEFLMDPYIISLPWLIRFVLVKGLIVPFRSKKSAHAYQSIWTDQGSPLRYLTKVFAEKIQHLLGADYFVQVGMRYGNPSIASALEAFQKRGLKEVILAPLYPQFSAATTTSSIEFAKSWIAKSKDWAPSLKELRPFYGEPAFIQSHLGIASPEELRGFDHVLFSFHGLPVKQLLRTSNDEHCLKNETCCVTPHPVHERCYRAQCAKTAEALAELWGLPRERWSYSFQSRLGRGQWIEPYTENHVLELARQQNVRSIAVFCPSFVTDCLETLEEVGIRLKESFLSAGGQEFRLYPCLNAEDAWAQGFALLIKSNSLKSL